MKRPFTISLLLLGLLTTSPIDASEMDTTHAGLIAAIELFRADGPDAALPDFERLQAGFNSNGVG